MTDTDTIMVAGVAVKAKPCSGCLKPIAVFAGDPCFTCVRARHRAALSGRCKCAVRDRRWRPVTHLGRTFNACDRCLGNGPATA